jgi:NAD(P)-dependent dehydrogenase (short-subunit alcohol dehydrogenase family)
MAMGSVYSASKAAALALVGPLAADFADRGIRVNSVTPGHIQTDMLDGVTGGIEQVREFFRGQVVTGRFGTGTDVADAVTFLLSARASYITGQDLIVDGGLIGAVPLPAAS